MWGPLRLVGDGTSLPGACAFPENLCIALWLCYNGNCRGMHPIVSATPSDAIDELAYLGELSMIEVSIDSVRVSLMSQQRIVVLRERAGKRYLPIWIGPYEADAITIQLQGIEVVRPMTHDLLRNLIETLDGEVSHVVINDLQNDTFYAKIVLIVHGDTIEVDSRPSDAIALAVRVDAPIYVDEEVMERAGMEPEEELSLAQTETSEMEEVGDSDEDEEDLDVFRDFIEGLDIDSLG